MVVDISAALSAVTAAMGLAKELRSIDKEFDKAELKLKIADLAEALSDAKQNILTIGDDLRERDAEITRLQSLLNFKAEKLIDKGQFRYFADAEGKATGMPICPVCERKGNFLAIVQDRSRGAGGINYLCPSCKANYGMHPPRANT
ncbi:hypothetical protein LQT97_00625 [Brucella pseudogrignonensis]|uniref:hypothetical protein n=1 Tax=Brucella pseudogrignonensis TaxID=419475 RepID=UPI001E3462F6|nr:hypothetical protein [Brucella pseudogrignonensis]MCD4509728.1 hypothetical protein [Brucella pseudogrignonensis]